jgi:3-hydroxy acid dehydrogenase/malonic semialdehyde reductase
MTKKPAKVVVITGASSGIGLACAEVYAKEGCALVLGARRIDRLQALRPILLDLGASRVLVSALDVRDLSSIRHFAEIVETQLGAVDILINNAGLAAGLDPVETGKDADWQAMLDTNVLGLLQVTRRFLPMMRRANQGHIVNMGSIAGFHTYANGAMYAGTKHAVKAISGALRLELNGTSIRVSEVDPGMVETEFSLVRLGDQSKADAVYEGMIPLRPEDIAECVHFATSRPPHVNIDHILVMPTDQASVYKVHRKN